jgi:hypothetical protein
MAGRYRYAIRLGIRLPEIESALQLKNAPARPQNRSPHQKDQIEK